MKGSLYLLCGIIRLIKLIMTHVQVVQHRQSLDPSRGYWLPVENHCAKGMPENGLRFVSMSHNVT